MEKHISLENTDLITVEVQNGTSNKLQVNFAGPDNKTENLDFGGTGFLLLKKGTYTITASVNAPNIKPYSGQSDLQGNSAMIISTDNMNESLSLNLMAV